MSRTSRPQKRICAHPSSKQLRVWFPSRRAKRRAEPVRRRDLVQILVSALPGLAALIAIFFTYHSTTAQIRSSNSQLNLAEQSQITDRFNAAIVNLGSSSTDVRLGGIYALQRIMNDSSRDQGSILQILTAFIRDKAPSSGKPGSSHAISALHGLPYYPTPPPDFLLPPTEIQAALTVICDRVPSKDHSRIDLEYTKLRNTDLQGCNLSNANFYGSDLTGASLEGADLEGADFMSGVLVDANLSKANLTNSVEIMSNLYQAGLEAADLHGAHLIYANLSKADLSHADFSAAELQGAQLDGANLENANLAHTGGLNKHGS